MPKILGLFGLILSLTSQLFAVESGAVTSLPSLLFSDTAPTASYPAGDLAVPEDFVKSSDPVSIAAKELHFELAVDGSSRILGATKELHFELIAAGKGVTLDAVEIAARKTVPSFEEKFFFKYQELIDDGYENALKTLNITDPKVMTVQQRIKVGQLMDSDARIGLKKWLASQNIPEGPGQQVLVNRRLYGSGGIKDYRIPDAMIDNAGGTHILDASLSYKDWSTLQIQDFATFKPNARITIVRPTAEGGSYSLILNKSNGTIKIQPYIGN